MIIFYRIIPFAIATSVALGFGLLLTVRTHPFLVMLATVVLTAALFARLVGFEPRTLRFWMLTSTPLVFLLSSFLLLLFLESPWSSALLVILTVLLVFFFAEHVFAFTHLPATYQAYGIEYLSLVLNVCAVFYLSTVGFGARLFYQADAPLWQLSLLFFAASFFTVLSTFWASKVDVHRSLSYAIGGALFATELFCAVTYLPTNFLTGGAFVALAVYLFLGLTRAHIMDTLTPRLVKQYAFAGFVFALIIFGTAQWV
jgi:hypothetical protein